MHQVIMMYHTVLHEKAFIIQFFKLKAVGDDEIATGGTVHFLFKVVTNHYNKR